METVPGTIDEISSLGGVSIVLNNIKKAYTTKHWVFIALLLAVFDYMAVFCSYTLALFLRFDFRFSQIPNNYWYFHIHIIWIFAALVVVIFQLFSLYRAIWRFASYNELVHLITANAFTILIYLLATRFFFRMPVSYYFFGAACQFILTTAIRFAYRFVLLLRKSLKSDFRDRIMIIGAGSAGQIMAREITAEGNDRLCCFIDDNTNKWTRTIEGAPVFGGREKIFEGVQKYNINKIIFAIPSAENDDRRDILQICSETGCAVKQLPSIIKLMDSKNVHLADLQDVSVEDLLGRPPIKVNLDEVFSFISGKTVLVTGGGGSIGSEICRQVASHGPKQLIIFDIYENNAYDIQLELRDKYPGLNLVTLIGSVRDSRRVNQIFAEYKPDIVYHAAAHKHVPLMEDSPCESIKNNVMGTYKVAYAAMMNGTGKFVLISTDKAVNPTNIMGASKRLCEMVVQTFDAAIRSGLTDKLPRLYTHCEVQDTRSEAYGAEADALHSIENDASGLNVMNTAPHTDFVAVRFGNVLGSNGSVVPIFKKQIANGGPVTVTHPDIIRYFMTVPEAVSLVLQAGTYAKGGEIFIFDMGSPVKIDTLARNLIRLSGLVPDVDIKIEYTGLRPGEKLYEEKLMAEEGMEKTPNDLIHIGHPIEFDHSLFLSQLVDLEQMAYDNDESNIRIKVMEMVSTYHPAENGVKNKS